MDKATDNFAIGRNLCRLSGYRLGAQIFGYINIAGICASLFSGYSLRGPVNLVDIDSSGRNSRSSAPDSMDTTGRVFLRWDIGR